MISGRRKTRPAEEETECRSKRKSPWIPAFGILAAFVFGYWQWRKITATESVRKAGNVWMEADILCRDGKHWPASGTRVGLEEHPIKCPFTGSVFVWDFETSAGSLNCDTLESGQPDCFFARSEGATIDGRRCFVFRNGGVILKDSEVDSSTHLRR